MKYCLILFLLMLSINASAGPGYTCNKRWADIVRPYNISIFSVKLGYEFMETDWKIAYDYFDDAQKRLSRVSKFKNVNKGICTQYLKISKKDTYGADLKLEKIRAAAKIGLLVIDGKRELKELKNAVDRLEFLNKKQLNRN